MSTLFLNSEYCCVDCHTFVHIYVPYLYHTTGCILLSYRNPFQIKIWPNERNSAVINKTMWMCGGNIKNAAKWSKVKWSKLCWGCEEWVSAVKLNEGKVTMKCEYISSWHYVFHYRYCLVYNIPTFINIHWFNCICTVFIVCSVSFIVCVVLCAVFFFLSSFIDNQILQIF
jgi:hypothetical protein